MERNKAVLDRLDTINGNTIDINTGQRKTLIAKDGEKYTLSLTTARTKSLIIDGEYFNSITILNKGDVAWTMYIDFNEAMPISSSDFNSVGDSLEISGHYLHLTSAGSGSQNLTMLLSKPEMDQEPTPVTVDYNYMSEDLVYIPVTGASTIIEYDITTPLKTLIDITPYVVRNGAIACDAVNNLLYIPVTISGKLGVACVFGDTHGVKSYKEISAAPQDCEIFVDDQYVWVIYNPQSAAFSVFKIEKDLSSFTQTDFTITTNIGTNVECFNVGKYIDQGSNGYLIHVSYDTNRVYFRYIDKVDLTLTYIGYKAPVTSCIPNCNRDYNNLNLRCYFQETGTLNGMMVKVLKSGFTTEFSAGGYATLNTRLTPLLNDYHRAYKQSSGQLYNTYRASTLAISSIATPLLVNSPHFLTNGGKLVYIDTGATKLHYIDHDDTAYTDSAVISEIANSLTAGSDPTGKAYNQMMLGLFEL